MIYTLFAFFRPRQAAVFVGLAGLVTGGMGCTYFHSLGSGAHMDAERPTPVVKDTKTRTMLVEVTTDAQGAVASISFTRSSGKEGIDAYVAETIRQGWPQQPSTRTMAEVTYSGEKGFTAPKVISSTPVP